ncbi:5-amino-6-(5-phosphoribosylamino)uracil reductase [Alkalihalobacillus alcalophilus ATCC 27647 = CGMCC 1.3604]|uniref:Riboflavin biosynthesis protein RibD n=1 Tax=Alkalihalobacillus alcalophilus ATCC 27647 = CGMCC 1.3604 TaxID=1218173 RepID=A0A094WP08_ALKAL|nr:bifunctional diaminohydroxyphosphoribosylaminopyrimidine deaminase/5-amino-6-(5-phosphoribosylamino)uracil reductase RibD [Alkalihalobacillus alcalophilus]KGA98576.1 5-amino-6-(5-phosphoribosylamino)uracil reductase [Alkalihalobacillus alcalophilus ATCC 27647 = CGMCC 1.3604]MED1560416.1 bifunctional diaminohydroxyphosphoribosylaminopyrimidine deaminase/5-amino-6-(5-phosphoribosylamino)uracil reductase RibD [Alkalihalobacillus alcalophilus]THG91969.1 5-amino-6-(5-phosphoribosylamino)uracil red
MTDQEYMELAIRLAEKTEGQTSPNPVVGAVVVKDGQVVGFGAHLKRGEGHAEVLALQMAGEKADGATVYVTLEPCSHYGKTPPCANLLVEKKVKRVVVATVDPNPQVSGTGIARLKEAGIEVTVGICEQEAIQLNEVFFYYILTKQPYVTLKAAMTLDGKIATVTGESKWITSEEARADVHQYRHKHDAILVGIGTVLADNPTLTTRLESGGKNPIRIVLDRKLRIPLDSKLVTDGLAPTWVFTNSEAPLEKVKKLESVGVEVYQIGTDLNHVLRTLGQQEITSLFVEGGSQIHGQFIEKKLVQQVITYFAPKMLAGEMAPTFSGGNGIKSLANHLRLEFVTVKQLGPDIKIISKVLEG